jgi:hypothetical protein
MCGATVQSMNHVRAMAETKMNTETNRMEITGVTETRLTGFVIHSMLASTILLLPLIKKIPIPVVSGVFLFLGRRLMTANTEHESDPCTGKKKDEHLYHNSNTVSNWTVWV